jgi:hypothetical protein
MCTLFAVAPSIAHWLVVALVLVTVPGALGLRARLIAIEGRVREAVRAKRDACVALRIAVAHAEALEVELEEARRRSGGTTVDPIYRRVGLDPAAPDYIVVAARRAHRLALHPDKHSPQHRQVAHERYVAAEAAFDAIARRRGASPR